MINKHFLGLRTTLYFVSDLEKAKNWYSQVLDIQPYFDESFYVGFNVAGYEIGLHPIEDKAVIYGNNHVAYWGVPDVKAAYQRLLDLGATAYEEPADVGGDIQVAAVKDEWGNVFGVIYNPHFTLE